MPESLGKKLKKIREAKHFSLEEVSERSRIHKDIVRAIEEDRIGELKSAFYAKSFVKTYAVFLGALDEEGVREYLAMSQKKPEAISKHIAAARHVSGPRREKIVAGNKSDARFSMIRKMLHVFLYHKKRIIAVVIGIFILWTLSLAIGQIVKFAKNISAKKQVKQAVVKKETSKKVEKQKPKSAIKVTEKETPGEKSDSVELEVSASDNTWLQVIVDGELMFTGLFKKGGKDTWKARKEIKLEAGNSGAIKVNVNGKPASFSGKKGKKKEIVITKDGIK